MKCELKSPGFKCPAISVKYLQMIPTEVGFKSQNLEIGEGFLLLNQTRLPFDISMESLEPFFISFDGYNFSSAGLRFTFRRNSRSLLIGGYYVPTTIFVFLSLVSYSIDIDMVRSRTTDTQWNIFFIEIPNFCALADKLGRSILGHLGYFRTAPILVLWVPCPCFSLFNHYFYKKTKPLYPYLKYLFGIGILIWPAKN